MAFNDPVFNTTVYQNGTKLGGPGDSASSVTDPLLTTLTNAGAIIDLSTYTQDTALFSTVMTVDAEGDFIGHFLGVPTLASATAGGGGSLAATTYYYVVTAVNANGETSKSNELSVTTTGTTGSVTLTWLAPTAPVAEAGQPAGLGLPTGGAPTGYNVYRGTSAGGELAQYVTGTTTLKFTDTGGTATATNLAPPTHTSATLPGEVQRGH